MLERFRDNYNYAKANMNDIHFKFSYVVTPFFMLFGFVDLLVIFVLLCVNSARYTIVACVLFSLFVVGAIVLLCFLPYVNKKDVEAETKKLDEFFKQPLEKEPCCEFIFPRANIGGIVRLTISDEGYDFDGLKYSFDGYECAICTSNFMHVVNLIAVFRRTEEGNKEDGENQGVVEFSFELDINMLSVIEKFNIKIVNPDVYKFIRDNTKMASKQILKYGKIQNNYYNVK